MVKIGIIGGSGLDNPEILKDVSEMGADTPYGEPSSPLKIGKIGEVEVVLLARHGRAHTVPPTQVNFRANIQALKDQGCTHILATTAVGSLKENIGRGDLVILDQFIDFTKHRKTSFTQSFEPHKPEHCPMAEPFCPNLRKLMIQTCQELGLKYHPKGTVVTIEGPRFSTKAESHMFRAWGADVINMSIAPEAALANEAKIPYVAVAMSTDYDCWKEDEAFVSWEEILKVFGENVEKVTSLLTRVIPKINNPNTITETRETTFTLVSRLEKLKSKIKSYPDWPKPGIMFRDINSLLNDPEGLNLMVAELMERYQNMDFDLVAGIESRGFITGSLLAHQLKKKFVLIRKPGKLPGEVIGQEYSLEYGTDKVEIQKDTIKPGDKVLLTDDLIATGGTALAAAQLIQKLGGDIVECNFVINLPKVGGKKKLEDQGLKVFNLIEFEGE